MILFEITDYNNQESHENDELECSGIIIKSSCVQGSDWENNPMFRGLLLILPATLLEFEGYCPK